MKLSLVSGCKVSGFKSEARPMSGGGGLAGSGSGNGSRKGSMSINRLVLQQTRDKCSKCKQNLNREILHLLHNYFNFWVPLQILNMYRVYLTILRLLKINYIYFIHLQLVQKNPPAKKSVQLRKRLARTPKVCFFTNLILCFMQLQVLYYIQYHLILQLRAKRWRNVLVFSWIQDLCQPNLYRCRRRCQNQG